MGRLGISAYWRGWYLEVIDKAGRGASSEISALSHDLLCLGGQGGGESLRRGGDAQCSA